MDLCSALYVRRSSHNCHRSPLPRRSVRVIDVRCYMCSLSALGVVFADAGRGSHSQGTGCDGTEEVRTVAVRDPGAEKCLRAALAPLDHNAYIQAYERCGPAKLAEMKKQTAIAKDA